VIDLSSDTQTRPTEGTRRAIASAEVGDEQKREDPTTSALQERVASLLGQEAALFLPSGSMCNGIGFRLHLRPGGDEVYLHRTAHPIIAEAGGPAALSGAMVCPLEGEGGMFSAEALRGALREEGNRYLPRSRLVSVEQTSNMGGGRVWPLSLVRSVLAVASERGMRAHLDGARLMNAVVASGVPAAEWAAGFDTCWVDFSKGLGAPVGACLAGSRELMEEAFRYKQQWGGSMRQSGIVAAAGLYALDHHVERLAEDHERARRLAAGLAELPGVSGLDPALVDTNIVIFAVADPAAWSAGLLSRGVRLSPAAGGRLRAITHLDIDDAGIERALAAAAEVARELR
jgi:threonine aldolase